MSKITIIEGNSNDKDNVRAFIVKGEPGDDGISPTATVTKTDGVATITIVDKNGTTTATVSDGEKGEPGATSNIIDSDTLTDNTTQTYSGRIVDQKIEDSVIPVHDEHSTSTTEPYSANYVNGVSIVESGSNANGEYIKFGNGTMVCTKKVTFTNVSVNQQAGSLYHSSALNLGNFAETFNAIPTVNVSLVGGYSGWITELQELTQSSIGKLEIFRAGSSTNLSYEVDVIAYGTYSQE